ncbi:preprotein translocase subunit SecE [Ruficoccus amylovorans]|uniref:Protein translocase subunit SecE n=1 Tax=Ruficoccus amylovorans TaxID=1804625 RepID=A0A842HCK7_9BACT|nr:preprotein translocase subunit SecE [Ruficoccus amylovorans]MBC2593337.1 preprotein translocase subunit SecE [Ruficoccus amylovorans]
MANPFNKIRLFFQETRIEVFKKAVWPNFKELKEMTAVVIIAVCLLGVYIAVVDFANFNFVAFFSDLVRGNS